MRMSDWSSDFCSSDLLDEPAVDLGDREREVADRNVAALRRLPHRGYRLIVDLRPGEHHRRLAALEVAVGIDCGVKERKGVVQGKSVYVSVNLGGCRIM